MQASSCRQSSKFKKSNNSSTTKKPRTSFRSLFQVMAQKLKESCGRLTLLYSRHRRGPKSRLVLVQALAHTHNTNTKSSDNSNSNNNCNSSNSSVVDGSEIAQSPLHMTRPEAIAECIQFMKQSAGITPS